MSMPPAWPLRSDPAAVGSDPCTCPTEVQASAPDPAAEDRSGLAPAPGSPAWTTIASLPAGMPLVPAPRLAVVLCPLASSSVAAGFPSPADDYVEARIDLNLELIPHPLATFFMRVSGNAMAGDGINDGDLLVIDRSVEARPGLVVVATHGGSFIVRRLEGRRTGGLAAAQLVASDGQSPAIPLASGEAEIWGVVIHAVHHLAPVPSRRR